MANVELAIKASSNAPEVLDEDERALRKQAAAHDRAQKEIAKIIARGDPLKQLELQKERELRAIDRAVAKSKTVTEDAEKARAAVTERYAKIRVAHEEAAAKRITEEALKAAQAQTRAQAKQLSNARTAITGVASAVGRLGGELGGAVGQAGSLGTSLIGTFTSGGPLAIGIGGATVAISQMVSHVMEAREKAETFHREQTEALAAETEAIEAATEALREKLRLEERHYGLTAQGQRDEADAVANSTAKASELLQVEEAIRRNRARFDELTGGGINWDPAVSHEFLELNRQLAPLEERRLRLVEATINAEEALGRAISTRAMEAAKAANSVSGPGGLGGIDIPAGLGKKFGPIAPGVAKRGTREAAFIDQQRAAAQKVDTSGADQVIKEFQRETQVAVKLRDVAEAELADALAAHDPLAQLELRTQRALDGIQTRLDQAAALAQSDDQQVAVAAIQAQESLEAQKTQVTQNAAFERIRLEGQAMAAARKREPPEVEVPYDQYAIAGMQAAASFASSFRSYMDSEDPADLFRGILGAAAGIFSLAGMPVVGGALGLAGGFFEQGGAPYAYHIPQGRRGLATLPSVNNDAKPAWLHEREVVLPKDVIEEDLGGMPEAMALAAGRGLPRGRGGSVVIENHTWFAWDSVDAMGAFNRQEQVQVLRADLRQGELARQAARVR